MSQWEEVTSRQRYVQGRRADVTQRLRWTGGPSGSWKDVDTRLRLVPDGGPGGPVDPGPGTPPTGGAGAVPTIPATHRLSKQWLFDSGTTLGPEWSTVGTPKGGGNTAESRDAQVTVQNKYARIKVDSPSFGTYWTGDQKTYPNGYSIPTSSNGVCYFWAEVRTRMPCLQYVGAFPCPLWFRPSGTSGGEMDVNESYGSDRLTANGLAVHATLFDAQGYVGVKTTRHGYFKNLPAAYRDPYGWHTFTTIKEQGRWRVWVDGIQFAEWNNDPSSPNYVSYYDRTCETTGLRWGLRTDVYVNSNGKSPTNVINNTTGTSNAYGTSPAWSGIDWSQFYMDLDYIAVAVPA